MIGEHRKALLAALVAAVAGGALEYRLSHRLEDPVANVRTPDALPALVLHDLHGQPVRLPGAYAGRPLLLNFWASWCAPCIAEMGELQRFSAKQASNGTQVIGIALDEPALVAALLKQHPVTYPILIDRPGPDDSSARLGNRVGMLPFSVLVSADGRVLKQRLGPFHAGEIEGWARAAPGRR